MSGEDAAPVSNLTGDVTFDIGAKCADFDYGYEPEAPAPANVAPVAAAVADPTSATTGQTVKFSGLGSTDDSTPVANLDYSWDFGDGGSTKDAAGAQVSRAFTEAGSYTVKLTVTDLQGLRDSATVVVTVVGDTIENTAPKAKAAADPSTVAIGETVSLTALGSTDAETPSGLTFVWDFDNGGATSDATGRDVTTSYGAAGTYDATVTVTDAQGLTDLATATVTVTAAPTVVDTTDPTAVAKVSPRKVFVKQKVSLDATGSLDDITSSDDLVYAWSKGDGGSNVDARGQQATVRYAKPGRYTVSLGVADEAGNTDVATQRIRVLRYVGCDNGAVDRKRFRVTKDADALRGVFCQTSGKRRGQHTITYSFKGQSLQILHGKAALGGFAKVLIDGKAKQAAQLPLQGSGLGHHLPEAAHLRQARRRHPHRAPGDEEDEAPTQAPGLRRGIRRTSLRGQRRTIVAR